MQGEGPSCILADWLFVGTVSDAYRVSRPESPVARVLNCVGGSVASALLLDALEQRARTQLPRGGRHVLLPLSDFGSSRLDATEVLRALDFVHEGAVAGEGVLIHCRSGVNRSCTLAVAYLVRHQNYSLRDALAHVSKARPLARPHPLYMQQLVALETAWRGASSITVEEIDVLYPSIESMLKSVMARDE